MKKLFLFLVILSFGWVSCQKNADSVENNEDQKLAGTHWITESNDAKTSVTFTADKTFKFSTVVEIKAPSFTFRFAATISGQWSYNGENIQLSNSKLEVTQGPSAAQLKSLIATWQNGTNSSSADAYTLVSKLLQNYNQYIVIDDKGNIQLSKEAAKRFVWAVKHLSDGVLIIKIGDKSIELKKS